MDKVYLSPTYICVVESLAVQGHPLNSLAGKLLRMISNWFIWCVTKNERKALKLLDRVANGLNRVPENVGIEHDEDIPGYSVSFDLVTRSASWNDMIVELVHLGYHVADRWLILPGWSRHSIYEAAESFSDDCRVTGVRRIQWNIVSPELHRSN